MVVGSRCPLATPAGFFAVGDQTQLLVHLATLQQRLTGIPGSALRLILPAPSNCRNHFQHNTITEQGRDVCVVVRGRDLDDVDPEDRKFITDPPDGVEQLARNVQVLVS
jgi:hypothetical protein